MKIIPLGTIVMDSATGRKGMLTHLQVEQDGRQHYYAFQPNGLHAETGQPIISIWLLADRVSYRGAWEDVDLPLSALGSKATDEASGFTGTIISLTLHLSGCVHVMIQPTGKLNTGDIIAAADFDIRRLSGKAIAALSKEQRSSSEKATPSPAPVTAYTPRRLL